MDMTAQTMKKLTKIRLINWHYFPNETIEVNDSFLISGDNGSGKSTVLDAIQLVLTTNTRRFNPAANEKSRRDLKGYVRCKTGDETNTYLRSKAVISYVALEFFEERKGKYFVLGVLLESPDENSDIRKRWFCEEGMLENLQFIIKDKPAMADQFRNRGKKVNYISSNAEAKERFKRRLGNLDDTFFDMIPKSLAFKPINNVKSFITQFILPEKQIDVGALRENIRNLREMQRTLEAVKQQILELKKILDESEKLKGIDEQILEIDILLKIAEFEALADKLREQEEKLAVAKQNLLMYQSKVAELNTKLSTENEYHTQLSVAIQTSESAVLIKELEHQMSSLNEKKAAADRSVQILNNQLKYARNAVILMTREVDQLKCLVDFSVQDVKELGLLPKGKGEQDYTISEKEQTNTVLAEKICRAIDEYRDKLNRYFYSGLEPKLSEIRRTLKEVEAAIVNLRNNKIQYPDTTLFLQRAIEKEFQARSIKSDVRILADLLEITDSKWQNAVEGYLNTQRFSIIVEPEYYDVAASVYDRERKRIHSVILVNTGELEYGKEVDEQSLAAVVNSENRYAMAYINSLLGRVRRCDSVEALKQYSIAITDTCMLYQGHGLRKIDPKVYKTPYIGKFALKVQLEFRLKEQEQLQNDLAELLSEEKRVKQCKDQIEEFNAEIFRQNLSGPVILANIKRQQSEVSLRLEEAKTDPTIIELSIKLRSCEQAIERMNTQLQKLNKDEGQETANVKTLSEKTRECGFEMSKIQDEIDRMSQGHSHASEAARKRFEERRKLREADSIFDNYQRRRSVLWNQRNKSHDELLRLQQIFRSGEFGTGEALISAYAEEYTRLVKHDLLTYEEKLSQAKERCELEFRESFLAKMRENIESAERIFKELNQSLKTTQYGNETYQFTYFANPLKQNLYDMITSDMNVAGTSLFTQYFEANYQAEMDELFERLTQSDEKGEDILREYSDYRSYLDYDIKINTQDGKIQKFSKIYGEKSGGETQTPYYVAIAASFKQIYSYGESIRIIMLDEAFDKMDDDRIAGMMKFFKLLKLQVILATPPAKMEVIGEHVDTILVAVHDGDASTIETYSYDEL